MNPFTPRAAKGIALVAVACAISACSKPQAQVFETPEPVETSNFKVSGVVTDDGKPVPYGYVLFYSMKHLGKDGEFAAPVVGQIDKSGRYVIENPVIGSAVVCLVTDPDVDPAELIEGATAAPGGKNEPGESRRRRGREPRDEARPPDEGDPEARPDAPSLTPAEKKWLKALHQKYADPRNSPLAFEVAGQEDETFDIILPVKQK